MSIKHYLFKIKKLLFHVHATGHLISGLIPGLISDLICAHRILPPALMHQWYYSN